MRITFLGHAGAHVETRHGSVLCDPWFTPAYFGSWFPFPRNDQLVPEDFGRPDFLYVSHLHRDHFDAEFLARHVDKGARVLLPDFPTPFLRRALERLGFRHFVESRDGEPFDLDGLEVAIFAMTAPADGPLGDSALMVGDASGRVLDQNDARPGDPEALRALGPYDAHLLQFSGAIWYPVVYDFDATERDRLAAEKRVNQMARAHRYIEWVKAAHVFPVAGPPCFLDDDLYALNDLDHDPTNIFPDQEVFLADLRDAGVDNAHLLVPGSVVDLEGGACRVTPPDDDALALPFRDKAAYLARYRADWDGWLDCRARVVGARGTRSRWPTSRSGSSPSWSGRRSRARASPATSCSSSSIDAPTGTTDGAPAGSICLDFVERKVRAAADEPFVYRITVDRALVTVLVEDHVEDWVNSLFLSCRFAASRPGPFNEYVMTFFKALGPEQIDYVERSYRRARPADEFFERDGWRIERWCPHRQADLTRFGEITDGVLTCSLHHWQFELASGRCLTSEDRHLRCERVADD